MGVTTALTTLKYANTCNAQVDTATVVGTISTAGNATVIVTARDLPNSPITISVAVALSDTASLVAGKIRTALNANAFITSVFTIGGTTTAVSLTRKTPTANDLTTNISVANGTCAGLTNALTSVHTTAGGTFTKLCDINNYPDMGSSPSKLDNTTLSNDKYKTSQNGLIDLGDFVFEANYDATVLNAITGLTGSKFILLEFGTDGKYDWQGEITAYANGGGVDEIRKMSISLSQLTAPAFSVTN